MDRSYQLFVKWGNELIPVLVLDTWKTSLHKIMKCEVIALHGKPFTDGHHKYPLPCKIKTFLASQVIVKCFLLLSEAETQQIQEAK